MRRPRRRSWRHRVRKPQLRRLRGPAGEAGADARPRFLELDAAAVDALGSDPAASAPTYQSEELWAEGDGIAQPDRPGSAPSTSAAAAATIDQLSAAVTGGPARRHTRT